MKTHAPAFFLSAFCFACGAEYPFDQDGDFVHIQNQPGSELSLIDTSFFTSFPNNDEVVLGIRAVERDDPTDPSNYLAHTLLVLIDRHVIEDLELPVQLTIDGTTLFSSARAFLYRPEPDASPIISRALFSTNCPCDSRPKRGEQTLNGTIEIIEYERDRMTGIADVRVTGQAYGNHDRGPAQLRLRSRFNTNGKTETLWPPL